MLCLRVLSHRLFLVTEIHLPPRVLVVVHQQEGHLGGGVLGPRQGMAGISCALLGGITRGPGMALYPQTQIGLWALFHPPLKFWQPE